MLCISTQSCLNFWLTTRTHGWRKALRICTEPEGLRGIRGGFILTDLMDVKEHNRRDLRQD